MENSEKKTFIGHVFDFSEDSKHEIMNLVQYSLLAIIPIIVLNKIMQKVVPDANEEKGSFEISFEIILQVVFIFIGLLFIHRIITFVPTYSGTNHPEIFIVSVVLSVLMITLSLQTKIGEKVNILVERISELWEGKDESEKQEKQNNTNQNQNQNQNTSSGLILQNGYTDTTSINNLPSQQPEQQLPNYDAMYKNTSNPLVGANSPVQMEPMAANDALGTGNYAGW